VSPIRGLVLLCLLASLAACRSQPTRSSESILSDFPGDPFESPSLTYYFGEGKPFTYTVDGKLVLSLGARDGRLFCNGVDTGPYVPRTPVRILSREELLVAGERRPIPHR